MSGKEGLETRFESAGVEISVWQFARKDVAWAVVALDEKKGRLKQFLKAAGS